MFEKTVPVLDLCIWSPTKNLGMVLIMHIVHYDIIMFYYLVYLYILFAHSLSKSFELKLSHKILSFETWLRIFKIK